MTGELTLTGLVMPIGGVKRKNYCSKRAGITQLIFPSENKKDFDDLDESIIGKITPYFVKSFTEVLPICFPNLKGTNKIKSLKLNCFLMLSLLPIKRKTKRK